MKLALLATACALLLTPLAARAQIVTTDAPGPGFGEVHVFKPSPELRAKMDQARKTAQSEAMNALSPDHREKVQSIVTQLQNGKISPERATVQIEDLLTPQESATLASREEKFHQTMRSLMEQMPAPKPRSDDAARYLLTINAKPGLGPPGPPPLLP